MLNIFEVGVDIDTKRIADKIEEQAETVVTDKIVDEVKKVIYAKRGYYSEKYNEGDNTPLRNMVHDEVEKIINDNKEMIIEEAAKKLSDKLFRSKATKEKLSLVLKEM